MLCIFAKLSNFKKSGFGKATTVWCIPGLLIFSTHYASNCTRADLSLDENPECRVSPSNKNTKSCLNTGLKFCIRFEQNITKYYQTFFFLKWLKKTYHIFCGYVRELTKRKKNTPRGRNVPTKMHSVHNSYIFSPNCIIPLKLIYCSNHEMEF